MELCAPSRPIVDTLRVGIAPWAHLRPECFPKEKTGCEPGVELSILATAAMMEGLNISLVITHTLGCGGKLPNGTYTGLLGMLQEGVIDMTANLCSVNKLAQYSQNFFSLSLPIWQYRDQFVIQSPTPPTLSFAPLAPFRGSVWIACLITWVVFWAFCVFQSYIRVEYPGRFWRCVVSEGRKLADVCCGFDKHITLNLIWPLWTLWLTLAFMFYNSYILSAVMYPFAVLRPFSSVDDVVQLLLSGEYRLLSYKDPPPVPADCVGQPCEKAFLEAVSRHGFTNIQGGNGHQLLSAIVEQDYGDKPKLVLINGMPYIRLYLSEYPFGRERLWLIHGGATELWVSYAWRKDFSYGSKMNYRFSLLSDHRTHALDHYIHPRGPQPHTATRIREDVPKQSINLERFRGLFFMHLAGMAAATIIWAVEVLWDKRHRRWSLPHTRVTSKNRC